MDVPPVLDQPDVLEGRPALTLARWSKAHANHMRLVRLLEESGMVCSLGRRRSMMLGAYPCLRTWSSSATAMPNFFAARKSLVRALSLASLLSKSVWLQRARAFRTWAAS